MDGWETSLEFYCRAAIFFLRVAAAAAAVASSPSQCGFHRHQVNILSPSSKYSIAINWIFYSHQANILLPSSEYSMAIKWSKYEYVKIIFSAPLPQYRNVCLCTEPSYFSGVLNPTNQNSLVRHTFKGYCFSSSTWAANARSCLNMVRNREYSGVCLGLVNDGAAPWREVAGCLVNQITILTSTPTPIWEDDRQPWTWLISVTPLPATSQPLIKCWSESCCLFFEIKSMAS